MIKDIVVNLSVSAKEGHAAEDYAICMASALKAHITGIAFVYDTNVSLMFPLDSFGEVPAEVIEALKRENADLANKAAERFDKAASLAGLAARSLNQNTSFAGSIDRFGQIARCFDLAIIGQVEPQTNQYEANIAEGALFNSGRPMIIVPYAQNAPFKLDRVMVCWDGGRPAARAVADAMPLLGRAGHIEVVTVGNERGTQSEGVDIGQHLARCGLKADIQRIAEGHMTSVAHVLLSHAANTNTDLIVMGGHGHSRMREFFLGDVTEPVLHAVKVPVLMSYQRHQILTAAHGRLAIDCMRPFSAVSAFHASQQASTMAL